MCPQQHVYATFDLVGDPGTTYLIMAVIGIFLVLF
jgi:hypothetical protein